MILCSEVVASIIRTLFGHYVDIRHQAGGRREFLPFPASIVVIVALRLQIFSYEKKEIEGIDIEDENIDIVHIVGDIKQ